MVRRTGASFEGLKRVEGMWVPRIISVRRTGASFEGLKQNND